MVAGRLRLRLFSHDEMVLMPGEVVQLLRHHKMMGLYLSGIIAVILMNWDNRLPGSSLELHAPPLIGAVLAGGLVPVLALLRADRLARRGREVVVSASRLFLMVALLGFAGHTLMAVPLGVASVSSFHEAVLDIASVYVLAEIIGGLAVHFVVPSLLKDLRPIAHAPAVLASAQANASPPSTGMLSSGTAGGSGPAAYAIVPPGPALSSGPRPAQVRVANRLFDAEDIVLVQAERTHVWLTTTAGRQILPGPFSAVVVQMPPELGQQVSRADWVANAAVVAVQREGRDVVLLCRDGQTLRVASARQAKLRDWFDQFSEEPRHAAQ